MAKEQAAPEKKPRAHKATYAADKRKGGWLVRVVGPQAGEFVGREVPVIMKGDSEHLEKLIRLIWSGADKETGKPCALYSFEPKPKEVKETEF